MNAPVQFTIDDVIARYVANRDQMVEISKRHAAELEPYNKKREVMEQWMLARLNAQHEESVKTEHGTAYKTTTASIVVDQDGGWDRLLDYIYKPALERLMSAMENGATPDEGIAAFRNGPEIALLNRSVNATAVKEIIEATQVPPPGVKVTQITKVGVRRPG